MRFRLGGIVYIWVKGSGEIFFFGGVGRQRCKYSDIGKERSWMIGTNL